MTQFSTMIRTQRPSPVSWTEPQEPKKQNSLAWVLGSRISLVTTSEVRHRPILDLLPSRQIQYLLGLPWTPIGQDLRRPTMVATTPARARLNSIPIGRDMNTAMGDMAHKSWSDNLQTITTETILGRTLITISSGPRALPRYPIWGQLLPSMSLETQTSPQLSHSMDLLPLQLYHHLVLFRIANSDQTQCTNNHSHTRAAMPNRLFLLLQISVCLSTATTISLKIDRSAIHIAISLTQSTIIIRPIQRWQLGQMHIPNILLILEATHRMTITMGERLKRDLSAKPKSLKRRKMRSDFPPTMRSVLRGAAEKVTHLDIVEADANYSFLSESMSVQSLETAPLRLVRCFSTVWIRSSDLVIWSYKQFPSNLWISRYLYWEMDISYACAVPHSDFADLIRDFDGTIDVRGRPRYDFTDLRW